jgi:hypothetical protein
MNTKHERRILLAILLLSVLLRVIVALFLGNAIEETRGGTFDQISYDALAQRVAAGHGFSFGTAWWPGVQADQPTAFWSYLYTLYLALVYALFGHAPLVARLIQATLVGAAMPWLTWRIGRRIFGPRPALIAAGISAVYFYFILYAASLMSEALYIVAVLWTVDAAMRLAAALGDAGASAGRRWRLGLELGLAMGVTLLLRQAIGPFLAVLALWFLWLAWRRGWLRRALGPLAAAAVLMALLLLPFVVRNYRAFGVVGMPNTNVGVSFFWANHPIYGTQFEAVLSPEHGVSYQELIPPELRGLNDALLDRALLDRGVQIVLDDPGRYLLLSLSRIPIYFQFWPTPQISALLSNAARAAQLWLVPALHALRPGSGPRRHPPRPLQHPARAHLPQFPQFPQLPQLRPVFAQHPGGGRPSLLPNRPQQQRPPTCAWPTWPWPCSSWPPTPSCISLPGPTCATACPSTPSGSSSPATPSTTSSAASPPAAPVPPSPINHSPIHHSPIHHFPLPSNPGCFGTCGQHDRLGQSPVPMPPAFRDASADLSMTGQSPVPSPQADRLTSKQLLELLDRHPGILDDSTHGKSIDRISTWKHDNALAIAHGDVLSLPDDPVTRLLKGPHCATVGDAW